MKNESGISLDGLFAEFKGQCSNIEEAERLYRGLVEAFQEGERRRGLHLKEMAIYRNVIQKVQADLAAAEQAQGELSRVFDEREKARLVAIETMKTLRAGIDANIARKAEGERLFVEKARPEGRVN